MDDLQIRESAPNDLASIETLYPAAFPDEDLLPLVRALLREGPSVLSLVAITGSSLVGHAAFTQCAITESDAKAALLGPLAITPAYQRRGIGRALVKAGILQLDATDISQIYVLGDPGYYSRLGFQHRARVAPPYPLPEEWADAWQWISLDSAAPLELEGAQLIVPDLWRQPALWGS